MFEWNLKCFSIRFHGWFLLNTFYLFITWNCNFATIKAWKKWKTLQKFIIFFPNRSFVLQFIASLRIKMLIFHSHHETLKVLEILPNSQNVWNQKGICPSFVQVSIHDLARFQFLCNTLTKYTINGKSIWQ